MASRAGRAPWSEGYKPYSKFDPRHGWDLERGYFDRWKHAPKKPKTKRVQLASGEEVEVPDTDYADFIGHLASPPSDPTTAIGQFIDQAFADMDKVDEVEGCGHITLLEYVESHQILRVEFATDGAVVIFFRVPAVVYAELYHLAVSKQTMISPADGEQRHVLGMRFWDIIRIRGQREGSRYKFEYAIEGTRTGSSFSQEMAAERASETHVVSDTAESLYDRYAKNMLTGGKKAAYDKLESVADKEAFLHKAGII